MKKLTIFTPTYNRAYCLNKIYESLCVQTNQDFLWLLIDDGSTDNTAELVQQYISEGKIEIKYIIQENAGKHVAHNKAVELCDTELFVCVDSEDFLTNDAIEIILTRYSQYKDNCILGLYLRRVTEDGVAMATPYPQGVRLVGITDLYHRYSFKGDTVIVLKTDLIKAFKFPVFEGERFVTERVFYNMLNDIAPMVLCEDEIYIAEYLSDGYTKNVERLLLRNPYGTAVDCLFESCYEHGLLKKIKYYAQYLALIKVFGLSKNVFYKYKRCSVIVRMAARILIRRYIKLYGQKREKHGV